MSDKKKIVVKRGQGIDLPGKPTKLSPKAWTKGLEEGEIAFSSDEGRIFVGSDPANNLPQSTRLSYPYRNIEVIGENSREAFARMHGSRMREGDYHDYYFSQAFGDPIEEQPPQPATVSSYLTVLGGYPSTYRLTTDNPLHNLPYSQDQNTVDGASIYAYDLEIAANGDTYLSGFDDLRTATLVKLSGTGEFQWERTFGTTDDRTVDSVIYASALDTNDNIWVGGAMYEDDTTPTIDDGVQQYCATLIKYSPTGTMLGSYVFSEPDPNAQTWVQDILITDSNILIAITRQYQSENQTCAVLCFDNSMNLQWTSRFGTIVELFVETTISSLHLDDSGQYIIASGLVDHKSHFIVKYAIADGSVLWNTVIEDTTSSYANGRKHSTVIDTDGSMFIIDNDGDDSFAFRVTKLDPDGNLVWQRKIGVNYENYYFGIADACMIDGYLHFTAIANTLSSENLPYIFIVHPATGAHIATRYLVLTQGFLGVWAEDMFIKYRNGFATILVNYSGYEFEKRSWCATVINIQSNSGHLGSVPEINYNNRLRWTGKRPYPFDKDNNLYANGTNPFSFSETDDSVTMRELSYYGVSFDTTNSITITNILPVVGHAYNKTSGIIAPVQIPLKTTLSVPTTISYEIDVDGFSASYSAMSDDGFLYQIGVTAPNGEYGSSNHAALMKFDSQMNLVASQLITIDWSHMFMFCVDSTGLYVGRDKTITKYSLDLTTRIWASNFAEYNSFDGAFAKIISGVLWVAGCNHTGVNTTTSQTYVVYLHKISITTGEFISSRKSTATSLLGYAYGRVNINISNTGDVYVVFPYTPTFDKMDKHAAFIKFSSTLDVVWQTQLNIDVNLQYVTPDENVISVLNSNINLLNNGNIVVMTSVTYGIYSPYGYSLIYPTDYIFTRYSSTGVLQDRKNYKFFSPGEEASVYSNDTTQPTSIVLNNDIIVTFGCSNSTSADSNVVVARFDADLVNVWAKSITMPIGSLLYYPKIHNHFSDSNKFVFTCSSEDYYNDDLGYVMNNYCAVLPSDGSFELNYLITIDTEATFTGNLYLTYTQGSSSIFPSLGASSTIPTTTHPALPFGAVLGSVPNLTSNRTVWGG